MAGILVLRGPGAATALLPSSSASDGAASGATWNSGSHQGRGCCPMYHRFARATSAVGGVTERNGKRTSDATVAIANSRPDAMTRTLTWPPRCLAKSGEGAVFRCSSSRSLFSGSSSHPQGDGQMLIQRRAVQNQGFTLVSRSIRRWRREVASPIISCEARAVKEDDRQQQGSLEVTWSNPTAEILREVIPANVWSADRPFVWLGIDVGGRMGVVRLEDGSIWVHSPVPLDANLKAKIDQLGPVRHIVSPNYEHCKYAQQWITAYPEAIGYACPGLREKFPEIGYQADIGTDNEPPETWGGEFHCMWLSFERNPFNGKPFFNEVVFVHKKSGTLFVTDFFWNYPEKIPLGSWLWKQAMDNVYLPFYNAFMIVDRDRFHKQLNQLLSWDWDCVFPCHGVIYLQGGKDALKAHYLSNGSLP